MSDLWFGRLVATVFTFVSIFLIALVGVILYFALTGGFTVQHRERVDGIDCVVVRARLTNSIKTISCPPQVHK